MYAKLRRKQVNSINSFRENPAGERIWIDVIEYIPEPLPEIIVGIDGVARDSERCAIAHTKE